MRDLKDLAVIVFVFLGAAILATFLSIPALQWAKDGNDLQGALAVAWLVACYVGAMVGATRLLGVYRAHCTTSVGRSQNS